MPGIADFMRKCISMEHGLPEKGFAGIGPGNGFRHRRASRCQTQETVSGPLVDNQSFIVADVYPVLRRASRT